MGDLSLLWHEYERVSDLAQQLTGDLIALERTQFGLPGEAISLDDLEAARARLGAFVGTVCAELDRLDEDAPPPHQRVPLPQEATNDIPASLLARIYEAHRGDLPRFVDELRTLQGVLERSDEPLAEDDWAILEELSGGAHEQTSRAFRRLRRR